MENPFETIARRLTNIENLLLDLKHKPFQNSTPDINPYGDFKWLASTCQGVPTSTLRIKSAAGEIPGVVKLGKRVLYEKAAVLTWLHNQIQTPIPDENELEGLADEQISHQLAKTTLRTNKVSKKGGERA